MKMTKRLIAVLTASVALFALAGCSMNASSTTSEPKDYAQIIHDARPDEDNENQLILSTDGKGGFTATDGYSSDMTAEDCKSQADNFILPMLGLAEGDYESFAASVSLMNVRSYAVAIVKPAEGKAQDVQQALEAGPGGLRHRPADVDAELPGRPVRDRQGRQGHHRSLRGSGAGVL